MEKENSNFTITINDGFCSYEYPLKISDNHSIHDVAEKIFELFDLEQEDGKLVKIL